MCRGVLRVAGVRRLPGRPGARGDRHGAVHPAAGLRPADGREDRRGHGETQSALHPRRRAQQGNVQTDGFVLHTVMCTSSGEPCPAR